MSICDHHAAEADVKLSRFRCLICGHRIPTTLTPRDLAAVEIALTGRRTA